MIRSKPDSACVGACVHICMCFRIRAESRTGISSPCFSVHSSSRVASHGNSTLIQSRTAVLGVKTRDREWGPQALGFQSKPECVLRVCLLPAGAWPGCSRAAEHVFSALRCFSVDRCPHRAPLSSFLSFPWSGYWVSLAHLL